MAENKPVIAVASVSLNAIGGIETFVINLALHLRQRNWQVHCLATNEKGNVFGALSKKVVCHDLSSEPLSIHKVAKAAKTIDSISPSVLLVNHCPLIHYALPLLHQSIKTIPVLHSNDPRFYKVAAMFQKRIFRWITPAPGVAEKLGEYLHEEAKSRIHIIPHGVDHHQFFPRKTTAKVAQKHICFVGFVAENKGADLLPEVMGRVTEVYNDARLTIIGGGPLIDPLKMMFEKKKISGNCIFLGPSTPETVAEVLGSADILLLPTRIEGFGLSIIEAMMSGAVPVVSRLSGITDSLVEDGITGILVEPDDIAGFADALIRLLGDRPGLNKMAEAGKVRAKERFTLDRMLESYEALFSEKDDRQRLPQRGYAGWFAEAVTEAARKGIDAAWVMRRLRETA